MNECKRTIRLRLYVAEEERKIIFAKMAQLGTNNLSAYLRKMAVDGYIVNLDLPELDELLSLLRRNGGNLNQLARRVHETGRIYDADLEGLRQEFARLWDAARIILEKLSAL